MCHLNDALACPAECKAKQNLNVLIRLGEDLAYASALLNCQASDGVVSFTPEAGANSPSSRYDNYRGAQA